MLRLQTQILNKCRLCQHRTGDVDFRQKEEFINQIFSYTNVKLNDETMQDLPKTVCKECIANVENFQKYVDRVKKVDELLRNCVQDIKQKYKCDHCSKSYQSLLSLQNHQLYHNKLFCKICKTLFKDEKEKQDHVCGVKLDLLKKSRKMQKNATVVKSEPLETIIADVSDVVEEHIVKEEDFDQQSSEDINWSGLDLIPKVFACQWPDCKKRFRYKYKLKCHYNRHEGIKPFLCMTCGKGYMTKNSLLIHERVHLLGQSYKCELCNIKFSLKANLRTHEKKYHEGVKLYCSQCPREFFSKYCLERHEIVHTGVRKFRCDTCCAAFFTSKELTKHSKYHQGIKKYKCNVCFKAYFESHHLTIHKRRQHTGERPYVCKVADCGKAYVESQKLKKHMQKKHPAV